MHRCKAMKSSGNHRVLSMIFSSFMADAMLFTYDSAFVDRKKSMQAIPVIFHLW